MGAIVRSLGHSSLVMLRRLSSFIIIVYYHPQAPATALAPEVRGLKQALQALTITVHEGILIGDGWHVSMSEAGLL